MRPVYVKESNMTIMSHSVFNCACKRVSLTVLTSRCVWENRASGEHGGPCLKLDTVVGADSLFSVVICSKSLPPTTQFDLLFIYFLQRQLTAVDMCFLPSSLPELLHGHQPHVEWSCDSENDIPQVTDCFGTDLGFLWTLNTMLWNCCKSYLHQYEHSGM